MNFDPLLKRYFPAVVCVLLAIAAYFQASGIGELVAAKIGDAPAAKPASRARRPSAKRVSAKPILERNPFDSVTGPLDGRAPTPLSETPAPSASGDATDDDPMCKFGRVTLIAASDDPEWSFAAIQGTSGGASKLRRVGDQVDGHTVEGFSWDRVWLVKDTKRCQMQVGDKTFAPKPKGKPTKKKPRKRTGTAQLPAELAAKITKVSDNEYNVERSAMDEILAKQAEFMRKTRIRPVKEGDKVTGLKLSRVRPGSLMDALGLKNGDELRSINGFELTDPQKALEAYGRLKAADRLTLSLMRGGKPTTIDVNIQ